MDTTKNHSPEPLTPAQEKKRAVLITIVIALVLIAAIWIWKSVEYSNLTKQAETEQQNLRQQATGQLMQAHSQHLKLLAKPFIWALRTEMLQGNMNQINLYMSDMVKEQNIQRIVIANTKGTVIASTNKKDEGQPFSAIANGSESGVDQTKIDTAGNVLTMTSPIMGFNNRLGTLLIKYAVPQPEL